MNNASRFFSLRICLSVSCIFIFLACDKKQSIDDTKLTIEPVIQIDPIILPRTEAAWLKGIGFVSDSITESNSLRIAIQSFLQSPTEDSLATAREQWLISHRTYAQLEMFISLGHSNPGLFGNLLPTNFSIDAQPTSPGYLDYFDVYTNSGIVNDIAVPLTAQTLRKQHGFSDPSEVSLGFHAIEYLLWGEAGNRLAADYIAVQELNDAQRSAELRIIDLPNNRRRVLLNLLSVILADDISKLKHQIENPADTLRQNYAALTPQSRMQLLQAAGYTLLTKHINWLNKLESNADAKKAQNKGENDQEGIDGNNLHHSQFSGEGLAFLWVQLRTVENILFDQEIGFTQWILSGEQEPLLEKFRGIIQTLAGENDRALPLADDQKSEMIATLSLVAEAIAPPSITDLN